MITGLWTLLPFVTLLHGRHHPRARTPKVGGFRPAQVSQQDLHSGLQTPSAAIFPSARLPPQRHTPLHNPPIPGSPTCPRNRTAVMGPFFFPLEWNFIHGLSGE